MDTKRDTSEEHHLKISCKRAGEKVLGIILQRSTLFIQLGTAASHSDLSMSANDDKISPTGITVSPPLANENFPNSSSIKDDSAKVSPKELTSTASGSTQSSVASTTSDFSLTEGFNHPKSSPNSAQKSTSLKSTSSSEQSRGRQHIKIPNINNHNGRSPLRSSQSNSTRFNTSRTPQNHLYQRRGSVASVGDAVDFSTSLGMPYSLNVGGSSTTSNNGSHRSSSFVVPSSGASSPRNSFSSTFNHTPIIDSTHSNSHRTNSDQHSNSGRKPSTEEVFDLMEREQDAIVLKLMKEIQQLKEDNRALRQTINQLTSPSNHSNSRSHSRSSIDSRRRNSSVYGDDEAVSITSSISTTPRSNFANLSVPTTSSRRPSLNLASANYPGGEASRQNFNSSNFDTFRSNTSTINMGNSD